jgi:hypothetical protein
MNNDPGPSGEDVISFEPGDVPLVLVQIARLGEGLKAEFDLLAGRMSWLVISESFIFSAFATGIANYRHDHPVAGGLQFLVRILPFVGMFLAVAVHASILAALSAINSLKNQRDRLMAGLPSQLRIDLISSRSRRQWWGNLPAHAIPTVFFLVWAAAFVAALN